MIIKYCAFSGVPNMSAALSLIFENIFLPTLSYLELHFYWILGNFSSYTIIWTYTFVLLLVHVHKTCNYKSKQSLLLLTTFRNLLHLPLLLFSRNKKVRFSDFSGLVPNKMGILHNRIARDFIKRTPFVIELKLHDVYWELGIIDTHLY